MSTVIDLWPHQARSIEQIQEAISQGQNRILLSVPTGGGKTRIMTELIREWLEENHKVVLYTNRKMLIEQTVRVMKEAGIKHGVRAAGWESSLGRDVQISSIQTENARVLKSKAWPLHAAHRVLVDEAHLQKANTAQRILGMHNEDGAICVGMTATPLGLGSMYDVLLNPATLKELREVGALVKAVHYGPDEPDTQHIKRQASGEYSEADVRKVIMTSTIFGRVIEWFHKLNPDRKPTILFAPDVAGSIWFAEQFEKVGIKAAHIDGDQVWKGGEFYRSSPDIRRDLRNASKSGEITIICNRFVMREGVDMPWLEHGIFATVFGALQSYLQSAGRLLRAHPGKEFATFQDHGGNWHRHGSVNMDREWSLNFTENIVSSRREENLRGNPNDEPLRCPQCSAIRLWRGPKCPACGFEHNASSRSRPVVQVDGTIREHKGVIYKERKVKEGPDTQKLWTRMYYRMRRAGRTFRQAEGFFFYENHYYPPRTLKLMPVSDLDWFEKINKVPTERLRT